MQVQDSTQEGQGWAVVLKAVCSAFVHVVTHYLHLHLHLHVTQLQGPCFGDPWPVNSGDCDYRLVLLDNCT